MKIKRNFEIKSTPEPWGKSVILHTNKSKNIEIGLFTVEPDKSMDIHSHKEADELIYVIKGTANFLVNDAESVLSEGSVILIPKRVMHKAYNTGSKPYECLYLISEIQ